MRLRKGVVPAHTHNQDLVDVVPHVVVRKGRVQDLEVCVCYVLEDQTRGFRVWVTDDIQQLDNIWTTAQVLQNLDLTAHSKVFALDTTRTRKPSKPGTVVPLDLLLLDRLENLYYATIAADDIVAIEHFAVLSTPNLFDNFIVVLLPVSVRDRMWSAPEH